MAKRRIPASFKKRTGQMYSNHTRRARDGGSFLDYTLAELRELVTRALRRGVCPYCHENLNVGNFGCDHRVPVCRGGGPKYANLEITCMKCNAAKGPLDYVEFRELWNVICRWADELRVNTLARLRYGARAAKLPTLPGELKQKSGNCNRRSKHEWGDLDAGSGQRVKQPKGPVAKGSKRGPNYAVGICDQICQPASVEWDVTPAPEPLGVGLDAGERGLLEDVQPPGPEGLGEVRGGPEHL